MEEVSLKEHFETLLEEKDKAIHVALVSLDKRLQLLNELRGNVATKDEIKALEKIVDELKANIDSGTGRRIGIQQFIGWILALIAFIAFIISIVVKTK
jgi:hypothetical protein